MVMRNCEPSRRREFSTADDSAEGLNLLQSLLLKLEAQDQMEGAARDMAMQSVHSKLPTGSHAELNKESAVRRLIQRLREES